jgi:hypothetical protein
MSNKYRIRFFDTRKTRWIATRQSLFGMQFRAVVEYSPDGEEEMYTLISLAVSLLNNSFLNVAAQGTILRMAKFYSRY